MARKADNKPGGDALEKVLADLRPILANQVYLGGNERDKLYMLYKRSEAADRCRGCFGVALKQ